MKLLVTALAALLALALPAASHAASLETTQRLLSREMAKAGSQAGAYVVDVNSGQELFSDDPDTTRMPASVEKLYTSATALLQYGANGRLSTTVMAPELPNAHGVINGNLVLRGGGDPTFDATDAGPVPTAFVAFTVNV